MKPSFTEMHSQLGYNYTHDTKKITTHNIWKKNKVLIQNTFEILKMVACIYYVTEEHAHFIKESWLIDNLLQQ